MFDDWAWKSFNRVLKEAKEPTPFKSKAQKRYKALRKKNDIYTSGGGHKTPDTGSPYTGKVQRFGTDRLRFENLQEMVGEIDLSSLQPHDELSDVLWQNGKLKDEIKLRLIEISQDFMNSMGLDANIKDIHIVGSMANYTYTDLSDIDVHIILDFSEISEDTPLVKKYFGLAKSRWNNTYGLILSGHDVEVYVEDKSDEYLQSGRYSIFLDEWIVEPNKEEIEIDFAGVRKKVEQKMEEFETLEKLFNDEQYSNAYQLGKSMKDKLADFRESGLTKEGEFSNENLAFKVLRRTGILEKINKYVKESYKAIRSEAGSKDG